MMLKSKEAAIASVALLLSGAAVVSAYKTESAFLQSLLIELASTFLGAALALWIVDIYLNRAAKRAAIHSLLRLIMPSIREHHNELIHEGWSRFGKPQFGELIERYAQNRMDPHALTPAERSQIYVMVKDRKDAILTLLDKLDSDLRELALLLGWSFDPEILTACFGARFAIAKLKAVQFDDSEQTMLDVCEHFLDTDISAFRVFEILTDIIGVPKSSIYQ